MKKLVTASVTVNSVSILVPKCETRGVDSCWTHTDFLTSQDMNIK